MRCRGAKSFADDLAWVGVSYLVEQPPHCDLLRLSLSTWRFVRLRRTHLRGAERWEHAGPFASTALPLGSPQTPVFFSLSPFPLFFFFFSKCPVLPVDETGRMCDQVPAVAQGRHKSASHACGLLILAPEAADLGFAIKPLGSQFPTFRHTYQPSISLCSQSVSRALYS